MFDYDSGDDELEPRGADQTRQVGGRAINRGLERAQQHRLRQFVAIGRHVCCARWLVAGDGLNRLFTVGISTANI